MGPRRKWSPVQTPRSGTGLSSSLIHATGSVTVPRRNAATVGTGLAFSLRHVSQVLSLPRMSELSTEVPAYSGEKAWPVCSGLCRETRWQDMSLLAADSAFWEGFELRSTDVGSTFLGFPNTCDFCLGPVAVTEGVQCICSSVPSVSENNTSTYHPFFLPPCGT